MYTWNPAIVSLMLAGSGGFGWLVVLIKLITRSGPQIKSMSAVTITAPIRILSKKLCWSPRFRGEL